MWEVPCPDHHPKQLTLWPLTEKASTPYPEVSVAVGASSRPIGLTDRQTDRRFRWTLGVEKAREDLERCQVSPLAWKTAPALSGAVAPGITQDLTDMSLLSEGTPF